MASELHCLDPLGGLMDRPRQPGLEPNHGKPPILSNRWISIEFTAAVTSTATWRRHAFPTEPGKTPTRRQRATRTRHAIAKSKRTC